MLDISGNSLIAVPANLHSLNEIQYLYMSDNLIESLPPTLFQLGNLELLDLSGNNIGILPSAVGELTSIKNLDLSNNNLTTLPQELGILGTLQYFNAESNLIDYLSPVIDELDNLIELNLTLKPKKIQVNNGGFRPEKPAPDGVARGVARRGEASGGRAPPEEKRVGHVGQEQGCRGCRGCGGGPSKLERPELCLLHRTSPVGTWLRGGGRGGRAICCYDGADMLFCAHDRPVLS